MTAKLKTKEAMFVPLDELTVWDGNYNNGDVGGIYSSIRKFGFNGSLKFWTDGKKNKIIMAGNHTFLALELLHRDWSNANKKSKSAYLPTGTGVIVENDTWYILVNDISHLSYAKAKAFAIADNRWAIKANQDEELLLQYLQDISDIEEDGLLEATGYDYEEMDVIAQAIQNGDYEDVTNEGDSVFGNGEESGSSVRSDGTLLEELNVTLDPDLEVHRGNIYRLSERHILIVASPVIDWHLWKPFLEGDDVLFVAYCGHYVTLTDKAKTHNLVMVQPDITIASLLLQAHTDIHGEDSIEQLTDTD